MHLRHLDMSLMVSRLFITSLHSMVIVVYDDYDDEIDKELVHTQLGSLWTVRPEDPRALVL